MAEQTHQIRMPDLGLPGVAARASVWHISVGREVIEGDRLLEVVAGEVAIDLPAPASGTLAEQCVVEDDLLEAGQLLGVITAGKERDR